MLFIVRTIFRNNNQFTKYICTNSFLHDKKSNKENFSNEKNAKEQGSSPVKNQKTDNLSSDASSKSTVNFSNSKKKKIKRTASALQSDPNKKTAASLVKHVAKELGGNKKKTSDELLNYLKTLDVSVDLRVRDRNRTDTFSEINLETSDVLKKSFFKEKMTLGIFNKSMLKAENQVKLKIWDDLEAEELAFQSKCSPKNYFEELINWTNEGKLWHFPIDNDQGLDEEAKISFTEHIFMEQYLEPWCPLKGPLRKFMELVLIGLSKNPYLTLEEKKSHIEWFKNYFEKKKKLLQELGAMGPPKEIEVPMQEQEKSS